MQKKPPTEGKQRRDWFSVALDWFRGGKIEQFEFDTVKDLLMRGTYQACWEWFASMAADITNKESDHVSDTAAAESAHRRRRLNKRK